MNIGGIQRLSLCDFPATPAAVIFLQGCNLRCPFCHNVSLLPKVTQKSEYTVTTVLNFLTERKNKIHGVVISGGEPTIQPALQSFIASIKSMDFKIKLDTNGTNPAQVQQLIVEGLLDYIAMDIKAPWSKYDILSGTKVQRETIQESIHCISNSDIPHHFRTTFVQPLLDKCDLAEIKMDLPSTSQHIVQKYTGKQQLINESEKKRGSYAALVSR
jgi:pyruvate formate lyase activating enzyme